MRCPSSYMEQDVVLTGEGPTGIFMCQFGPCSSGLHMRHLGSAFVNGSLAGRCVWRVKIAGCSDMVKRVWGEDLGRPTPGWVPGVVYGLSVGTWHRWHQSIIRDPDRTNHQGNLECYLKAESSFEKSPNCKSLELLWPSLSLFVAEAKLCKLSVCSMLADPCF